METLSSTNTVLSAMWAMLAQFLIIYFEVGILTLVRKMFATGRFQIVFIGIAAGVSCFWVVSWWSLRTYGGFWGPLMVANSLSLDSQATLHLSPGDTLVIAQLVASVVISTTAITVVCGQLAKRISSASLIRLSLLHISPVVVTLSISPDSSPALKDLRMASGILSPEINLVREIEYLRGASQLQGQLGSSSLEMIEEWAHSLATTESSKTDVVVILVEALRADTFSKQRNPETVMPNILSLAQSGTLFTRAFAGAPETGLAIETLILGTYPYHGPLRHHMTRGYSARIPSLYDLLIRAGYRVGHFSSTDWSSTKNLITRNPRVWYQVSDQSVLSDNQPSIWLHELTRLLKESSPELFARLDTATVRNFQSWLHTHSHQPTFSFVYLVSSHFPWNVAEPEDSREPPGFSVSPSSPSKISALSPGAAGSHASLRAQYEGALHQADRFVGVILEIVRQRRKDRPVVVILLGDHGEAFGEHGAFLHSSSLYDEQIRIPVIISVGETSSKISEAVVSQVDVAPSILKIANLPPFHGFQGSDVLATQHTQLGPRAPIFLTLHSYKPLLGAVSWPYKAIYNSVDERLKVFNLESDPGETTDIAGQSEKLAETFLELITSYREKQPSYHAGAYVGSRLQPPPHYSQLEID